MKQIKLINLENVSEPEASGYKVRQAVRAITFDADGSVALFHSTKNNYYKIPGGGIEEGESLEQAIKRECIEEIGCDIEITGELGSITEYRKKYGLNQTSHCYIAKVVGAKGKPQLMPDEIEEGFVPKWMPLDEAIQKIKTSQLNVYEAPYMVARDIAFLEAAAGHVV